MADTVLRGQNATKGNVYSLHTVHALWGTIMILDCAF